MEPSSSQQAETYSTIVGTSNTSEPNTSEHVANVKKLIHRRMLVGIKDGRFFVGAFYCLDRQGNIILQDAVEYRSTRRTDPSQMEYRAVGIILIPFSCRTTCHVDCSIEEQFAIMSLRD